MLKRFFSSAQSCGAWLPFHLLADDSQTLLRRYFLMVLTAMMVVGGYFDYDDGMKVD